MESEHEGLKRGENMMINQRAPMEETGQSLSECRKEGRGEEEQTDILQN